MIKILKIILIITYFANKILGQNLISDDVNDTLSVDRLGTKIEFENDLILGEKWNMEILKISKIRKDLKSISKKNQIYYQNAYQSALLNQGYFEARKGNVKKEIECYFEVLKSANKKDHAKVLAFTYSAIGGAYTLEKEFQKGLAYYNEGLKIANQLNDPNIKGIIIGGIAFTYKKLGFLDKSLEKYFERLELMKTVNNSNYIGKTLYTIAKIYIEKKEYGKASSFLNKAVVESMKLKDYEQLSETYLEISKIYKLQNNRPLAEKYLLDSYESGIKSANLSLLGIAGIEVSRYYKKNKNFPKALEAIEYAVSAKDSLNKEDNKNAVLKAEFKYETEKKEAQIKNLSQQKQISELQAKRKNNFIYSILGGILALAAIAYFSFTKYRTNKENELLTSQLKDAQKRIEIEHKATESELKALKSQMNPHFMFNALNGIQEQFMYGDKKLANEQMGNFTSLTRQILEVSGKKKITLATEIDILKKYLALEKMRFQEDFDYNIAVDDKLDEDYHQLPPMLIQPFVENAVKHGLMHKKGAKKIDVNFGFSENEQYIIVTITDNGVGREKSAEINKLNQNKHKSFSTAATESRLQLLANANDTASSKQLIEYQDITDVTSNCIGTKVVVTVPV
jgi:two-component system, LytTR family, sensor kinase